jgi:hypothetical protein
MYKDEKRVYDESLRTYSFAVDLVRQGFACLEKLISLREHPFLEGYREHNEMLALANSICIIRSYKTLNVILDSLLKGYYSESLSLFRNVLEIQLMIKYFSTKPEKAELWVKNKIEAPKYGNMCDELGLDQAESRKHYKQFCEHTHPNFNGNIFFKWDVDKIKKTKELHFSIELHNTFNEFLFLGMLNHLLVFLSDSLIQQLKTLNLTKEAIDEWVRGAMGIEKTRINEVFSEMMAFRYQVQNSYPAILKRMIQIAKENGVPEKELENFKLA